MRRLHIVWIIVVILALSGVPTMAQGGTIATVIRNRSDANTDFTILQEFLDAAPTVRNRLNRVGTYTVFAPDDRAFRNLEGALGLDLSTILADIDVVTAILDYHIIESTLSEQALRQRNGQVLQTRLLNAFIGVRVDEENRVVVNNVVEITQSNITASNGTIHVINDVLLNRVVNNLINDRLDNRATVTPTATPSPTSTPPPTQTVQSQVISTAYLRFANFAYDVSTADVSIGSEFSIDAIEYGAVSDFMTLTQGIYSANIGSSEDDIRIDIDLDLTLLNGDFITLALIGSEENRSLQVLNLNDDFSNLEDDESRLVIFHAIEDVSTIDLILDNDNLTNGLRFAEFEVLDIDSGDVDLSLVETRDIDTPLVSLQNQTLADGVSYLVVMTGTSDSIELVIAETNPDDFAFESDMNSTSDESEGSDDVRQGTIIEVLDDEDDFTILIEALSVVDADVRIILNSDEITFFAPNDQAFRNLLSTIGYSQSRFLANEALVTDILLYHTLETSLLSNDLRSVSGTSIETRLRPAQAFFVSSSDGGSIFLNGSVEIIQADIEANNGVIHVIDNVLLPQSVLDILGL